MSQINLTSLDQRIKATKTSDLIHLNQRGERDQIEQRAKLQAIIFLLTSGVLGLVGTMMAFRGNAADYLGIAISSVTILVMVWAYLRGGKLVILSIAAMLGFFGIYNILGTYFLVGSLQVGLVALGAMQLLFALYFIQQANAYERLTPSGGSSSTDLYEDVFDALSTVEPNNSNNLIELRELQQTITVWLRAEGVVILLQGEKRLYFDVHRSFALVAERDDTGGDQMRVSAKIIDQTRRCLISRHGWLRYTRFVN